MEIILKIDNVGPHAHRELVAFCRAVLKDDAAPVAEPTPPAPPAGDARILERAIRLYLDCYVGGGGWPDQFRCALEKYARSTPPPPVAAPDAEELRKLREITNAHAAYRANSNDKTWMRVLAALEALHAND